MRGKLRGSVRKRRHGGLRASDDWPHAAERGRAEREGRIALAARLLCPLLLLVVLASVALLTGCGSSGPPGAGDTRADSGSGTGSGNDAASGTASSAGSGREIVIGSLATEDILPLWVAEAEDIFAEQGLTVSILTFQSAQELTTAVVSGAVDMAMT
ncbi:MAG: ABC transporter substrate-binding protein, partial [Coriobacteriales bacterium]|nr:ABC transporter substrate-binding protein [Coriobacteriales bacterium]